jgi:xanthine dehydrogenase accessory factor
MRRELLEKASELARRGEPFALATVVARSPPISAHVGDMAIVTGEGGFFGWVGGSCTRPTVIAQALQALDDGRPRLVGLDPNPESRRRPGLTVFPMTCHSGGSVEIHIQPVMPAARLVVYGLSPTARALVRLGKAAGFAVDVVDPAAEAADFPDADAVYMSAAAPELSAPRPHVPVFAVVATQGQWDEEAVAAVLASEAAAGHAFAYLAVMASPKRFSQMRPLLADKAPEARLARIKNPAGLDLGAELPEEVALSILAEIVKERRTPVAVGAAAKAPAAPKAPGRVSLAVAGGTAGPGEARDPVCGMTVTIAGAAHRAEHDGRAYYFCCGGCRTRFLATPEQYLAAEAARA